MGRTFIILGHLNLDQNYDPMVQILDRVGNNPLPGLGSCFPNDHFFVLS